MSGQHFAWLKTSDLPEYSSLVASSFIQHLISPFSAIQELEELLTEIKDISVVLGIDNTCKLDLSRIVEEVRAQYEALALRSWEEAEALTRRKVCPLI